MVRTCVPGLARLVQVQVQENYRTWDSRSSALQQMRKLRQLVRLEFTDTWLTAKFPNFDAAGAPAKKRTT
ncbi:hypothetical protein GCM10007919_09500 [Rhizobium indigoferae]|nr:hypothetical protein GCM10007919_09500 [Rhizobium indigoferae]